MNKIIAFSLWGNNPKYTIGAIRNAEIAKKIYPTWKCRFYVGKSVSEEIVSKLKEFDNVELVLMDEDGDWTGMFWRFLACEDADVMLSRDTDSRLSEREYSAVYDWLNSDKDFHIMRDHPYHTAIIMGGMWGCRNGILKNIKELISNYNKGNFWQVDQNFLKEIIYPIIKNSSFIHDEFFEGLSFPKERIGNEFVGDVFDEFENRHTQYYKIIKNY
jgi:hypothetical protein